MTKTLENKARRGRKEPREVISYDQEFMRDALRDTVDPDGLYSHTLLEADQEDWGDRGVNRHPRTQGSQMARNFHDFEFHSRMGR